MADATDNAVNNGVKVAGELLLPGSALMLDGSFTKGFAHTAAALACKAALGLPGLILVSVNSLSSSLTGRSILGHIFSDDDDDERHASLKDRVRKDVEADLTLDEIRDDIVEDVEDLFHEIKADVSPSD